jgi:hypothetical protein
MVSTAAAYTPMKEEPINHAIIPIAMRERKGVPLVKPICAAIVCTRVRWCVSDKSVRWCVSDKSVRWCVSDKSVRWCVSDKSA